MSIDPISAAKSVGTVTESLSKLQKLWRWWQNRRYPKPPLNHFGIVVAIITENDAQRAQFKSDFINTLKYRLQENEKLAVLELSDALSSKIETEQDILSVLEKTESVFVLWGRLRRRQIDGSDTYVMDLRSAVRHSPIAPIVQMVLAREMDALLPERRLISAKNDLLEFEINAVTMNLVARYVIAEAAFLSNQPSLALELSKQLIQERQPLPPPALELMKTLKERTVSNLTIHHLNEASRSEYEWRKSRNISCLETMLKQLDAAESYIPKLYQAAILRALYMFVTTRNVKSSRQILMEFSALGADDATWAFDMAFFHAYEGKLTQATGYYKKAFAKITHGRVLVEIEEWLLWILTEEPDKTQLHYCVGLVNYFGKKDFVKARQDFENFLATSEGKYARERKQVAKYLEQIQAQSESGELPWDD